MDPLNITVKVSNLIDLDGTVVRGLWFKHDFFTDLCPSFNALREMEFVDLKTSLMFEFQTRQSMINVHLNEMREVRETYEMKMEEIRKEEESQKKSKKVQENVKVGKAKKIEVEPPIVDESTYVDVEAEYVNYEDQQMEKQMNCLSPRNFNLKEHEMNMREYQIVKGVFKIECFDRPCQWTDVNQQMFTRVNDDYNLLQYQTFEHEYSEPEIKPQRKSIIDKNPVDPRAVALADLIRVEIKLDENIFWPEVPVVCRWELWEESEEFEALDTETKDFNLNYDKIMMEESEKLFSASEQKHCLRMKLSDFDLKTAPENIKLSNLIKHYIVPMMPYEFHYFNEQLEIFEKKQREWKQILQAKKKISENDVENLNLKEIFTENLSKIDIRNITVDEFNKLFDAKNYQPRELFPINYPELIEIIPNSELENLSEVKEKESLEELIRKQKERDDDDVDIGLQRPLKDEPLLVTELHEQVNKLKESLRPIFREIKREEDSVSFRVSDKSKRPRYRSNRASMLRRSIARDSKRQQSESPKRRSQRRSSRQRQSSKVRTRTSKRDEVELPEDKPERSSSSKNQQESSKKVLVPHNVGKWSTKYIYESSFDHELKSVAFYSGRLGNFGLATRKYCHFPLKNWELYPEDDHIVMKVESRHASIEFKITSDGYTFDFHPDLLDFLKDEGNETINSEDNFEKSKTIWFIQALLMNICPLSFSN
ncbi:CLUMA_CG010485, isoform A [Clunio marinus]|uniref:CLUMA_CG010485, isoform A n=1 Tax=Clunio marinus TaxID=568069 RepID=A0A1J1IBV9_9DIPT|nr:CLUMA_CG010485, isoform A [Clunio marinus]